MPLSHTTIVGVVALVSVLAGCFSDPPRPGPILDDIGFDTGDDAAAGDTQPDEGLADVINDIEVADEATAPEDGDASIDVDTPVEPDADVPKDDVEVLVPECGSAIDCDDQDPCTVDTCDLATGQCSNAPAIGSPCDDGDACSTEDSCNADGLCAGIAVVCDDDNICTNDSCDPASGCVYENNTNPCDDSNPCTNDDHCTDGVCSGTTAFDCDDDNPCTTESCDLDEGCLYINNTASCDDDDACTTDDTCSGGACQGTAVSCDDSNVCTGDSCDPTAGCVHENLEGPCDDGDACTLDDACTGGSCAAGELLVCNDSNPCTNDSCDPASGCVYANNTDPCDDDDPCTTNDVCAGGACVPGAPPDCDDDNPCTTDSCVAAEGGCVNLANTEPCDDGDACTTGDTCQGGTCQGGPAANCDDGNICTDDSCNPASGCTNVNNTTPCDDDDECTTTDVCQAGACLGSGLLSCTDDNPCTNNSCNAATGCVFTNNTQPCNDDNECTTNDVCQSGVCAGTPSIQCDDDNICTTDRCDTVSGCVYIDNTAACDDGDACTTNDSCFGGACSGTPETCDDGLPCTTDTCVADGDSFSCTHSVAGPGCWIDDACYAPGAPSPQNSCQLCQPATTNSGWTTAPNGATCDDGSGVCVATQCVADMVFVPSGPFWMGCNETLDSECQADEFPQHEVSPPAFAIDRTEVTVEAYSTCALALFCDTPNLTSDCSNYGEGLDAHPVNYVTWQDASTYCSFVGKRLCTEAEWEKAARGGCELYTSCQTTIPVYPWGSDPATCDQAVLSESGESGAGACAPWECTWPAGSKPLGSSPYNAQDLAGNVWEWVQDCYAPNYLNAPLDGTAYTPSGNCPRVVRGGSFLNVPELLRASARAALPDDEPQPSIGFRCCLSLD